MIFSKKSNPSGFYVYSYLRHDNTPYYIGKGSGSRAWVKTKSEIRPPVDHTYIVIVEHHLSEIGALAIERRMIEWYGRKDLGTGVLRNMTAGGDGVHGRKVTKATVDKSIATKRKTGGIFKCGTPNARKKATATRLKNNNGVYSTQTEESIAKGLETKRNNKTPRKNRVVVNSKNQWRITSSAGEQFVTNNLANFCKEHNISSDVLRYNLGKKVIFHKSSPSSTRETLNSIGWMLEKAILN